MGDSRLVRLVPNLCGHVPVARPPNAAARHLFESSLDLHPLSPGNGWIGQAVTSVGPATEVDALLVQVAKCFGHHLDGVVGQCRGVLKKDSGGNERRQGSSD